MTRDPSEPQTTDRLRHDIDSGLTGDKVKASDPSAVPLGADDEAAGHPPSADRVAMAADTAPLDHTEKPATHWPLITMLGVAAVIVALALSFVW